jgi:hypothetical protein
VLRVPDISNASKTNIPSRCRPMLRLNALVAQFTKGPMVWTLHL